MTDAAWVAIGLAFLSTAGVIITAMIKIPWRKPAMNQNQDPKVCPAHSGIVAENTAAKSDRKAMRENQDKMWTSIETLRKDAAMNTQTILKAISEIKK